MADAGVVDAGAVDAGAVVAASEAALELVAGNVPEEMPVDGVAVLSRVDSGLVLAEDDVPVRVELES